MISAVVIVKNEEENLKKCLQNLSWCDEIVVIDDFSSDKTKEIAKTFGAKIFEKKLDSDFSAQRNFGLSKAKNEWVFFVDADEIVSEELRGEIRLKIRVNKAKGFFVKRVDFMWGEEIKHGEFGNIKLLRLGRRDFVEWKGKVHETLNVKGSVSVLKNPLYHYPHKSINSFLKEINFYTDIRARELFDEGKRADLFSIVFYTKAKFIQNYFIKLGILDGVRGLILSLLMSLHSFLVRGKLWQLENGNNDTY